MCKYGTTVDLELTIVATEEYGGIHRKVMKIDACIAPLVKALDNAGVNMKASCCGHGQDLGNIVLSFPFVDHILYIYKKSRNSQFKSNPCP